MSGGEVLSTEISKLKQKYVEVYRELNRVIKGHPIEIGVSLASILVGPVLLEGPPGTAKTSLVKSIAKVLGFNYVRIQGLGDLMPSDLVGTAVWHAGKHKFVPMKGPLLRGEDNLFVHIDEINRIPERAQAGLLESLEERQISMNIPSEDGGLHLRFTLPEILCVMGTMNPYEYRGTYPLTEVLLDRFVSRIHIGYTDRESEIAMLEEVKGRPEDMVREGLMTPAEFKALSDYVVALDPPRSLMEVVVDIVRATRRRSEDNEIGNDYVIHGASPRSTKHLVRVLVAYSWLVGKRPDLDMLSRVAPYVLAHRIQVRPEHRADGVREDSVVMMAVQIVRERRGLT